MLAIGRDDPVPLLEHRDHTHGDRLLSVIEVQEASDLFLGVKLRAFVLEPADADHVLQQVERMGSGEPRLIDGRCHRSSLSSVEMSPSGRPSSRALSSRRMILPLRVLGRFSRKTISLGAIAGPSRLPRMAQQLLAQSLARLHAILQRDEGLDHLSGSRVRDADHANLGDGGVLHERTLDFERPDEMAGALDHVVRPADEPIIAVSIFHREVAGEIPPAGEAFAIAFLFVEIGPHHRRPAWAERKLAHAHGRLISRISPSAARSTMPAVMPGRGRPMEPGLTSIEA